MTSPHLADQTSRIDPVDALRLLIADLQTLADRLGLKERSRSLQRTLKAAQERVSGPRTVVMLLGEHAELKRQFLERLLGPDLAHVPNPVTGCMRLEYGAEPECTVTMPQGLSAVLPLNQLEEFLGRRSVEMPRQVMQSIRLPNPTLKRGLAVIDTPVVESGEPEACVLECAEQADAWIFVLNADHSLSEASQSLLCRLPERAERLEMVVEGAEALSGEARLAARERLETTLRESCNITDPRLTLVASSATEGDEGSFWHGRFATFHSVMMLRGRERWLTATRTVIANALSDVGAEIDFELKNIGLGLRHARLRLGLKDLEGLKTRFRDLGLLDNARPRETSPVAVPAVTTKTPVPGAALPAAAFPAMPAISRTMMDAEAAAPVAIQAAATPALPVAAEASNTLDAPIAENDMRAIGAPEEDPAAPSNALSQPVPEQGVAPLPAPQVAAAEPGGGAPLGEPTFVGFRSPTPAETPPKRGLSVKLSGDLARLVHRDGKSSAEAEPGKMTLPRRIAGLALMAAFACLILWAIWPRAHRWPHEIGGQWSYQPSQSSGQPHAAGARQPSGTPGTNGNAASLPPPVEADAGPDTAGSETPAVLGAAAAQPGTPARTQLPRPQATPAQTRRAHRHHHHLLGLRKLWHWVRRDHGKSDE